MLVDQIIAARPTMSEASGIAAREAFDKDLAASANTFEATEQMPKPAGAIFHDGARKAADGTVVVRKRSDELRATWGLQPGTPT